MIQGRFGPKKQNIVEKGLALGSKQSGSDEGSTDFDTGSILPRGLMAIAGLRW